jgi:hypothetical protein
MFPWEIWAEIFEYLLYEPSLADSNPFYPGCSPHTALAERYDEVCLQKVERQRRPLRLVCQTWKAIADRASHQFYQLCRRDSYHLANTMCFRASRIHLCVKQDPCRCRDTSKCTLRSYNEMHVSRLRIEKVRHIPPDFQPPLRTLMLTPY